MYTNSILGTAVDERHVWYVQQQRALAEAREQGEYHVEGCACGQEDAVVHDSQNGDRLVPIKEFDVSSIGAFLANDECCERCAQVVAERLNLDWDWYVEAPENGGSTSALDEPDWVAQHYHENGVEEVRSQWYDEAEDEDSQALQKALNAALGRVNVNSYGKPMHAFLQGRDGALCGERLEAIEWDGDEEQGTWPASEGWDTLGELLDQWLPGGNSMYCTECAKGLAEQTDTLRGFQEDALERFAAGHQRAQEGTQ